MGTALVAGGASGIGAAVVQRLRERGDNVVIADIAEEAGQSLALKKLEGTATFTTTDFTSVEQIKNAVRLTAELGDGTIDTIFYNPAVLVAKGLSEWTLKDWDDSLSVNLRGAFFTVQAAQTALAKSKAGRVILNASTGSFRGHAGMPAYHASKAGMLGLVRSLADELASDGTTVNAVCPGWIDTAFNASFWEHQANPKEAMSSLLNNIPMRRQGDPDEVAKVVLFLASSDSSYITGQSIIIDGGYTAV